MRTARMEIEYDCFHQGNGRKETRNALALCVSVTEGLAGVGCNACKYSRVAATGIGHPGYIGRAVPKDSHPRLQR